MPNDSARTELMAKLRYASRSPEGEPETGLTSLGSAPAANLPGADIYQAFLINVLKNQGSIDIAQNRSDAIGAVGRHLHRHFGTRKLVAGNDPRLAALPWRDGGVLPRFGAAEQGDNASLSYARLGIAETGSIVTFTGRENPAANNLLVEAHLVMVDVADLVTTLDQAWERINAEFEKTGRPRGVNFISGPSSTADIDAQMVMGAHGPRAWHVILVGNVPVGTVEAAHGALEEQPQRGV